MRLSVVIPSYNENAYLAETVQRVIAQSVSGIEAKEIIIVDDGSKDGTEATLKLLQEKYPDQIKFLRHPQNRGKGAAVNSGIDLVTGDICIIQDADWEYSPSDYPLMLEPILAGRADCVYGSRFVGSQSKRVLYFWHYVGNKMITLVSNMTTNLNLTDMETGFKAFRADIIKNIQIECHDFGFEPEITAKISRLKCRIYEVGISYQGRSYEEGKKIIWVDGIKAILVIIKYWLMPHRPRSL